MPSRTPRYEVRVQNEREDRGYPCATMEECRRIARQNEGTIVIYDRKRPGLQIEWFAIYQEAQPTCDACEGSGTMQAGSNEIPCEFCGSESKEATVSEQFHPNMSVTSWDDEDPAWHDTKTSYNEEGHDEMHPHDCTCQQCADTRELDLDHAITWMRANNEHGHWTAEIARLERWRARETPEDVRAMVPADAPDRQTYILNQRIYLNGIGIGAGYTIDLTPEQADQIIAQKPGGISIFKKALAGAALIAALLLPGHASAREDATQDFLTPPANCELYLAFEDHSSLAYCESMGEWIAFDPDITGTDTGWHMTPYTYTTAR